MSIVDVTNHEIKVFFRRLIVPAEFDAPVGFVPPSTAIGADADSNKETIRSASDEVLTEKLTFDSSAVADKFATYEPSEFLPQVVAKATKQSEAFVDSLNLKKKSLAQANSDLADANRNLATTVSPKESPLLGKVLISSPKRQAFKNHVIRLTRSLLELDKIIASDVPSGKSPRVLDNDFLLQVDELAADTLAELEDQTGSSNIELSGLENRTFDIIFNSIASIIGKTEAQATLEQEKVLRNDIINAIFDLLALRSLPDDDETNKKALEALIQKIKIRATALRDEIRVLQVDVNKLAPFFDPILLDALLGPATCTTSVNRMGQPGRASMSFILPLETQGTVPDMFLAIENDKVFNLDIIEQAPNVKGTGVVAPEGKPNVPGKTKKSSFIPARTLNILKSNMRETLLRPMDMVQVWMRRRFAKGHKFPNDYYPTFTGFITKTDVTYSGSEITVNLDAEDVAKILRLARVNIDPAALQGFRPEGINVTPYNNYLNSPSFTTGSEIIKALVRGAPGSFLGLSQVEITTRVQDVNPTGDNAVLAAEIQVPKAKTTVLRLATEFEGLLLNLFEDLNNRWKPYVNQFKSAFKLWETDYKLKWDIALEVAGITEFEMYADNMGVINYHPPLYFLNPFDVQYLIMDVDIDSETHSMDEMRIMTVADISSEPNYLGLKDTDFVRRASSMVTAPLELIQRFGIRWAKKDVPIFSGIDNHRPKSSGVGNAFEPADKDQARTTYARAWLNRRNMEAMSGSVTLNGVPEIRVCNTVAFVGEPNELLRKMVKNPLGLPGFKDAKIQNALSKVQKQTLPGLAGSSPSVGLDDLTKKQQTPRAVEGLDDVLVYYVSEVTHKYVQGVSFKTTLGLTHGRHWTNPLPFGSVGFGLGGLDTNTVWSFLKKVFGQGGSNPAEFAQSLSDFVNYTRSGNTDFIKRAKVNRPRSQFGYELEGAVEPGAIEAESTSGATDPVSPECKKLSKYFDPDAASEALEEAYEDVKKKLAEHRKLFKAKGTKLSDQLSDQASKALGEAKDKVNEIVNTDPAFLVLDKLLKGNPTFLSTLGPFGVGSIVPDSLLDLMPTPVKVKIVSSDEPIVAFTFVAKEDQGSLEQLMKFVDKKSSEQAAFVFQKQIDDVGGKLKIGPEKVKVLFIKKTGPIATKKTGGEGGDDEKAKEEIIMSGIVVVKREALCK